jgi:hypothetical protein
VNPLLWPPQSSFLAKVFISYIYAVSEYRGFWDLYPYRRTNHQTTSVSQTSRTRISMTRALSLYITE